MLESTFTNSIQQQQRSSGQNLSLWSNPDFDIKKEDKNMEIIFFWSKADEGGSYKL